VKNIPFNELLEIALTQVALFIFKEYEYKSGAQLSLPGTKVKPVKIIFTDLQQLYHIMMELRDHHKEILLPLEELSDFKERKPQYSGYPSSWWSKTLYYTLKDLEIIVWEGVNSGCQTWLNVQPDNYTGPLLERKLENIFSKDPQGLAAFHEFTNKLMEGLKLQIEVNVESPIATA